MAFLEARDGPGVVIAGKRVATAALGVSSSGLLEALEVVFVVRGGYLVIYIP